MTPSASTVAKTGLGLTAVAPWLWNYYVWMGGYGPEMTPEVAGAVSALVGALLGRITA